jgi:hypothetical protein
MEGKLAPQALAYRGEIRNFVMLGTPNGGFDLIFRHPQLVANVGGLETVGSWLGFTEGGPLPSPWLGDVTLKSGLSWLSAASGSFDGILEMATRENGAGCVICHPFRPRTDRATTGETATIIQAAYNGTSCGPAPCAMADGTVVYPFGQGIDSVTHAGRQFISLLNATPLPDTTNYFVIGGINNQFCLVKVCLQGQDNPSDGIVFLDSVQLLKVPNLSCQTAKVNHVDLLTSSIVTSTVVSYLQKHQAAPAAGGLVQTCR